MIIGASVIGALVIDYAIGRLFGGVMDASLNEIADLLNDKATKKTISDEIEKATSEMKLDDQTLNVFDENKIEYENIRRGFCNQIFRFYDKGEGCWYVTKPPCVENNWGVIRNQLFALVTRIRNKLWGNNLLSKIFKKRNFQNRLNADLEDIENKINSMMGQIVEHGILIADLGESVKKLGISVADLEQKIEDYGIKIEIVYELVLEQGEQIKEMGKKIDELDAKIGDVKKMAVIESYTTPKRKFIGREEELSLMEENLTRDNVVIVNGFGGIGKSELCREYVRRYKERGEGKVVWLIFDKSIRNTIVNKLKVSNFDTSKYKGDLDAIYEAKFNVMASEENLLLVLDNYEWGDDLSDFITNQSFKTIITTRHKKIPRSYNSVDVGNLSESEAFELLKEYSGDRLEWVDENREAISELLRRISHHTLTIVILGGLIWEELIDVKSLSESIFNVSDEEIDIRKDDKDVYATIRKHIDVLISAYSLNREEEDILAAASLMPVDGMELSLFVKLAALPDKALKRLFDINLLNKTKVDKTEYISMHPLITEYIWDKELPSSKDDESKYSKKYMLSFNGWMCEMVHTASIMELYNKAFMLGPLNKIYRDEVSRIAYDLESACSVIYPFYYNSIKWYEWTSMTDDGLKVCESFYKMANFIAVEELLCPCFEAYITMYGIRGDYGNALKYCLELEEFNEDGRYCGKMKIWNLHYTTALLYYRIKKLDEAMKYAKKASESEIEDSDLVLVYELMYGICKLWDDRAGMKEYGEKIDSHGDRLTTGKIDWDRLGDEIKIMWVELSSLLSDPESSDEPLIKEKLKALVEKLDGCAVNQQVISFLDDISMIYKTRYGSKESLELTKLIVEKKKKLINDAIYPEDHLYCLHDYYDIAMLELRLNEADEALYYFQKALDVLKDRNYQHEIIKEIYVWMGTIYYERGEVKESLAYFQRAMEVVEKQTFYPELEICEVYDMVGTCYYELGETELSKQCLYKSMEVGGFLISNYLDYPEDISLHLALNYSSIGEYDKALDLLTNNVLSRIDKISNDDLKLHLYALTGELYLKKGENEAALKYYEKAESTNGKTSQHIRQELLVGKLIAAFNGKEKVDESDERISAIASRIKYPKGRW